LKDNFGIANRYIEEDITSGTLGLVYLDFLLALHQCLKDFEYFIKHVIGSFVYQPIVNFGIALFELTLFCHFNHSNGNFPSFIPREKALLQNFLASNLILGSFIQQKFRDDELNKLLYKHLFLSVYKMSNNFLVDKLLVLNKFHNNWSPLYRENHSNLKVLFLENLSLNFERWLNQLFHSHNNIYEMLKVSSNEVETSINNKGGDCHAKG